MPVSVRGRFANPYEVPVTNAVLEGVASAPRYNCIQIYVEHFPFLVFFSEGGDSDPSPTARFALLIVV